MRQILWHNARSHLISCLSLQKMGLFRHLSFNELTSDSNTQVSDVAEDATNYLTNHTHTDVPKKLTSVVFRHSFHNHYKF